MEKVEIHAWIEENRGGGYQGTYVSYTLVLKDGWEIQVWKGTVRGELEKIDAIVRAHDLPQEIENRIDAADWELTEEEYADDPHTLAFLRVILDLPS